jgi:hypothetical protein
MQESLKTPWDAAALQKRAEVFSLEASAKRYLELLRGKHDTT